MSANCRSSSATSTLSSRTSGVSSGETGSSTGTPPPPPQKRQLPQNGGSNYAVKSILSVNNNGDKFKDTFNSQQQPLNVNYQRRYATLTKPKAQSPQKSATVASSNLMRHHSFQIVSNRQKLIQSENSAFLKVPPTATVADWKPLSLLSPPPPPNGGSHMSNTAKFFAKESHPNKFLTSTPIKDAAGTKTAAATAPPPPSDTLSLGFKPVHKVAPPAVRKPLRQASFTALTATGNGGPTFTTRRLLPQIIGKTGGGIKTAVAAPFKAVENAVNGSAVTVTEDEKCSFIGNDAF